MGTLWRSESMQLIQLFVQNEAAHDTVDELGNLGLVQFQDLNADKTAFQRNFAQDVKRCDEIERKLRFMEEQVTKTGIDLSQYPAKQASGKALGDVLRSANFDELEKELKQMNENQEMLNRNYNELVEMKFVLEKAGKFFDEASRLARPGGGDLIDVGGDDIEEQVPLRSREGGKASSTLGFVAGTISRDKRLAFERVMFRATRGNMFVRFAEIDEPIVDPHTGDKVDKDVFIVFYSGERAQAKINKICEAFGANRYPYPENREEQNAMNSQVVSRIVDLNTVIERTEEARRDMLTSLAAELPTWQTAVRKEKAIYHTLNMFNYDVTRQCLIAEGWCPQASTDKIQIALRRATETSGAQVPSIVNVISSKQTPPTFFRTNKFTSSYQAIVDAYGMARYREINPAVLSIVTFPFLFGVMFGDVGHGIILLLFALYMLWNEKAWMNQKLNEIIEMCFDGRYVLLLMSMFAIYCGFIYNDCLSLPLDLFGSSYYFPERTKPGDLKAIRSPPDRTYPFGVDPAWKGTNNQLPFMNSLKMKLSIILGITQMTVGIVLSYFNARFFNNPLNILYEFIPQMIFLMSLFGYMVVMIVWKWCVDWFATGRQPPDLIHTMIGMFLSPGKIEEPLFSEDPSFQASLQSVLVVLALIAVPWMLLPKPLILKKRHEKSAGYIRAADDSAHDDQAAHGGGGHGGHDDEEFNFGEVMIHQMIHTIEFVLGAISNTASYLRLWALSLAHAELSDVFWNRVLFGQINVEEPNPIFVLIGFAVWSGATLAVLCIMESLSAFLHALRLHWVEFMNKFYGGDGYKFIPFDYKAILTSSGDSE